MFILGSGRNDMLPENWIREKPNFLIRCLGSARHIWDAVLSTSCSV